MNKQEFVDRFLAVSYLYFQLNQTNAADISHDELAELFETLNRDNDSMLCTDYVM